MKKSFKFYFLDCLYLLMMILPILAGIVLRVLTHNPGSGVAIHGAQIYCTISMPIQNLVITEAQINSWLVIIAVFGLCLYLTHGLSARFPTKRQVVAEWIVEKTDALVHENMGSFFAGFTPFVCAILALSGFSSLLTLFGLYPPTSDLNVVAGWAILVFILITYYKMKCGPWQYIKSFGDPVPLLSPLNVISEVATPISMAFRHYGNVLSGTVISTLVAAGLSGLSAILLGNLPGILGEIPFLQIGIPAVLSVYFDIFSGCLQAYIFAMLTMLYISSGFPLELYEQRKLRKATIKSVSK